MKACCFGLRQGLFSELIQVEDCCTASSALLSKDSPEMGGVEEAQLGFQRDLKQVLALYQPMERKAKSQKASESISCCCFAS